MTAELYKAKLDAMPTGEMLPYPEFKPEDGKLYLVRINDDGRLMWALKPFLNRFSSSWSGGKGRVVGFAEIKG